MKKRLLLFITIVITLSIFIHSIIPGDESQMESDSVFLIFDQLTAFLHLPNFFNEATIRKLAHFVEFSFLGFFLSATVHAYSGFKYQIFKILFFILAVPVTDECLQYFSDGRSAQVRDVLIDFSGGLFGFFVLWISIVIVNAVKRKKSVSNKS